MNVSGPIPVQHIQRTDESALALRVNQRFAADVIQVAGERVTLAVNGVQIVARMATGESAAALTGRRQAQFVVRDLSDSGVLLQLAGQPEQVLPGGSVQAALGEIIPVLLQQAGLPVETATVTIARALLARGLPVSPEMMAELQAALDQILGWGEPEAQIAAGLRSLGLPLSPEVVALAQSELPALVELLGSLQTELRTWLGKTLPERLAARGREALQALSWLQIAWGDSPELAERLRLAARLLGRSLEGELARLGEGAGELELEKAAADTPGMLTLALLGRELEGEQAPELKRLLERFMDGMRLVQYFNARPESSPAQGRWLRLDLPLALPNPPPNPGTGESWQPVHLRIAYTQDDDEARLEARSTRMVVRVVLSGGSLAGESLQIDLAVAGQRVGATVTASCAELEGHAAAELDTWRERLGGLGYSVQRLHCELGPTDADIDEPPPSLWQSYSEIRRAV